MNLLTDSEIFMPSPSEIIILILTFAIVLFVWFRHLITVERKRKENESMKRHLNQPIKDFEVEIERLSKIKEKRKLINYE